MESCCCGSRKGKIICTVIGIILIVLAVGALKYKFFKRDAPKIDPNVYQAVELMGGQTYIGHLSLSGHEKAVLSDVYYVQQNANQTDKKDAVTGPGFTLRKLGGEVHGPEDTIYLNWQNVLFWENLKPDSKVVQGIMQDKMTRSIK